MSTAKDRPMQGPIRWLQISRSGLQVLGPVVFLHEVLVEESDKVESRIQIKHPDLAVRRLWMLNPSPLPG